MTNNTDADTNLKDLSPRCLEGNIFTIFDESLSGASCLRSITVCLRDYT